MIEVRDVTKVYPTPKGAHVVLDRIAFSVPPLESVGVLGRNGAGKSTLLRIIGGAELPDLGEVHRAGRISWPIGFSGGFHGSLTGEENCRFVARIYGADPDEVIAHTEDFAEIGHHFRMPVKTYSTGMRSRLAFGLSMAIDFDVYLVDEVTAVGDERFQAKCREAFRARRDRSSLIVVSHRMQTIRQYCSRCIVLEEGRAYSFDDLHDANVFYRDILHPEEARERAHA